MFKYFALLLFATQSCAAWAANTDFVRTPIQEGHPVIGKWRGELPEFKCFEEYQIRADGTNSASSAEERSESEFSISATPNANGYYVWIDKIITNNGKPDCSGSSTKVGHIATGFVLMHPSHDKFLMCYEQNMKSCFTEMIRQK